MTDSIVPENKDNAQVKIPPPLCFGILLILGIILQSDWIAGRFHLGWQTVVGGTIFLLAFIAVVWEALNHSKAGSNVEPWKPTTLILSKGLYKYSRNPIYVGMIIAYLGISLAAGSWASIILLPIAIVIIRFHVIAREEAYLERKFGSEYLAYKQKVRRWI